MEDTAIRPARGANLAGVLKLYRHLNPGDPRPDPARAGAVDCYKVMLASGRDEGTLRFYESCGFKRGGKTHFEARHL